MPFEAGLTVGSHSSGHAKRAWFLFEAVHRRMDKSLSDLSGTDAYIHEGKIQGVFRQLNNAFHLDGASVHDMWYVYKDLRTALPIILKETGSKTAYERAAFRELVVAASGSAHKSR